MTPEHEAAVNAFIEILSVRGETTDRDLTDPRTALNRRKLALRKQSPEISQELRDTAYAAQMALLEQIGWQ